MVRKAGLALGVVCLLTILFAAGGCSGTGDLVGSGASSETGDSSTTSASETGDQSGREGVAIEDIKTLGDISCGERTVTAAPASTFLEFAYPSSNLQVSPADAPLALAMFGADFATRNVSGQESTSRMLVEVDADGRVVANYYLSDHAGRKVFTRTPASATVAMQFVVDGGCLSTSTDADLSGIVPQVEGGPCGVGAFALTRSGMLSITTLTGDTTTTQPAVAEHICIQLTVLELCVDCSSDNGEWRQKSSFRYRLTAVGALDQVRVISYRNYDSGGATQAPTVDIADGDSVELSMDAETIYRTSPSPSELGYEDAAAMYSATITSTLTTE